MILLLRKIVGTLLVISIVLSSIGLTIVNHICNFEQTVYVGVEEFNKKVNCHHNSDDEFCSKCQNLSCCGVSSNSSNPAFKNNEECCVDSKFFNKIEVISNEKNLKKFSESFIIEQKVYYIKQSVTDYFSQKIEQIRINIINPVRKLITFIHLVTNIFNSPKEEALL
ncbi:MAG: hypothetical protein CH6_4105 [Candidatus Kapaibacterium sp.]|jgi:hypothetical protein|nr:MAG: hypothetical protein CH6_4105 [Candidatus Kapabacteria bacterium]ROL58427.1 MAG: hypothetical protein D9V84_01485 [Bacteroidetes/Chlorobi group bacterium Naka2016]